MQLNPGSVLAVIGMVTLLPQAIADTSTSRWSYRSKLSRLSHRPTGRHRAKADDLDIPRTLSCGKGRDPGARIPGAPNQLATTGPLPAAHIH
jgi:hypothetical protein